MKTDAWKYIKTILIGQYTVSLLFLNNYNRTHSHHSLHLDETALKYKGLPVTLKPDFLIKRGIDIFNTDHTFQISSSMEDAKYDTQDIDVRLRMDNMGRVIQALYECRLLLLLLTEKSCSGFVWNSQGAIYYSQCSE